MRKVLVEAGLAPIEFRLEPGHAIRGRVVDAQGKPVAGAYVGVDQWRDGQTLDWRTETDPEGRFRWDGAPEDRVRVYAGKTGYRVIRGLEISPSDQDTVIALIPGGALRIRGTVVDSQTGRPVPSFRIVPAVMGGLEIWLFEYRLDFPKWPLPDHPVLG